MIVVLRYKQLHLLFFTTTEIRTPLLYTMAGPWKDITRMTWRETSNAPEKMARGAGTAIAHENLAYFRPAASNKIYTYQNMFGQEQWFELPENPNMNCGLAVINGALTTVGGFGPINSLLCLTGGQWSKTLPPMITRRMLAACVTTEQSLVVLGGFGDGGDLDIVEVMNINTKLWTIVSSLPQKQQQLSATVCGDTLYLAGGLKEYEPSKSVFTCSLTDLLTSSNSLGSKLRRVFSQKQNAWKEIQNLPVTRSTLTSFNGQLLAIGGDDNVAENYSDNIYRYDSHTNTWNVISRMKNNRSSCLAVTLLEERIIVVGGYTQVGLTFATDAGSDGVEIFE